MTETELLRKVQLLASERGWRLFRNNTGVGWVGVPFRVKTPRTVLLRNARRIRFGLAVGSSDLIGWDPQGHFCALEIKSWRGKATEEQLNFIDSVKRATGRATVIRSLADAEAFFSPVPR